MIKVITSILFLAWAANASKIVVNDVPGEGDYTTIQAAVSAAKDGDTIEIKSNSDSRGYREQVTITTPNLTITGKSSKSKKRRDRVLKASSTAKNNESNNKSQARGLKGGGKGGGKGGDSFPFDALDKEGFPSLYEQPDCPNVFLDGCDDGGSCSNTVLMIDAPGVTIEKIFLRHGNIEFASGSDGGKFIKNCILGDDKSAEINTSGSSNSITVSNNFFQGGDGHSVELDGNFHEISYNLVVPCDNGFFIDGDDGLITNNKFFGCNDEAIEYNGDRGTIKDNEMYHGDTAIDYDGNDGVITSNKMVGFDTGIEYSGGNGRITDNEITSTDKKGIQYDGDNGIITDNEIFHTGLESIDYDGDNGVITDNKIYYGTEGIDYVGDNPTIAHNIIKFFQNPGMKVRCVFPLCTGGTLSYNDIIGGADDNQGITIFLAKNFLVEGNQISYTSEIGLLFSGDNTIIRGNLIARGGTDNPAQVCSFCSGGQAIDVRGSTNIIEDNVVNFNTFDGIKQNLGNDNVYRRNTLNGNGRAGIRVEGGTGTVISDNTVINNHGEGIAVEGGTSTVVRDNEALDNRIDICNNPADTVAVGNTFITGGFPCESGLSE